jgi:Helix-turn-helix domain
VNDDKLNREREWALTHPVRRALRDALDGSEGRTLQELGGVELPKDPSLSAVHYHLKALEAVKLVACVGGVYRLA